MPTYAAYEEEGKEDPFVENAASSGKSFEGETAAATTAHTKTRSGAPHTRLRVAGFVGCVAMLLFLAILAAYMSLVDTIEPPTITLDR